MSLSCSCDFDLEPGAIFTDTTYNDPDRYRPFEGVGKNKIRKRCSSCNEFINIGDDCLEFPIYKIPEHEVEINIHGEDGWIPMARKYMCEKCGDQYINLTALGYCVWIGNNMFELLKEYAEIQKERLEYLKKG
jgi:predicted RNA-binding Zn-ribbon protein involved in translation (DUF1610 family)